MSNRSLIMATAAVAAAAWLVVGTISAQAQDAATPPAAAAPATPPVAAAPAPARPVWRTMPIDPEVDKNSARVRSQVLKILRDGDSSGDGRFGQEEQDLLTAYYGQYALRRWTLPAYLTELAGSKEQLTSTTRGLRAELQLELAGSQHREAFDFLTARSLAFMQFVIKNYEPAQRNFHPASRVNAMLMIGELGASPPAGFGQTPPPLDEALPILLSALQDPEQIDGVRVAALVGILRHATLGGIASPQAKQAVVTAMVALANSPQPPERSADGHAWMRSQAAEILGKLGVAAGGAPQALGRMVADAALPISIRCVAADALGQLNLAGVSDLNPPQFIAPLGRLAYEAIAEEDLAEPNRDRFKSRLTAVAQGLIGLRPIAASAPLYASVSTPVAAILTALDDRRIRGDELKALIQQNHQQLGAALGVGAAAPAEPTAPETPETPEPADTQT